MVSEWVGNSGLRRNACKTQAIVFVSKKNVNDINSFGLPGIGMQNGVLIPMGQYRSQVGGGWDSHPGVEAAGPSPSPSVPARRSPSRHAASRRARVSRSTRSSARRRALTLASSARVSGGSLSGR